MSWTEHDKVWTVDVMVSSPESRSLIVRKYEVLAPSMAWAEAVGERLFRHFEPDNAALSVELVIAIDDRRAA
jgi:hypothetical protein